MSAEHSVEEVRELSKYLADGTPNWFRESFGDYKSSVHTLDNAPKNAVAMLTAYADLLERIKADERAVPVEHQYRRRMAGTPTGWSDWYHLHPENHESAVAKDGVEIRPLFIHPPAQTAQMEIEVTARPCQEAAERAISNFLREELGQAPSFTLAEDGEPSDGEKCGWSFWVTEDDCEDDTTSYVHADLSIEWYGTAWEAPTAEPVAQPRCWDAQGKPCCDASTADLTTHPHSPDAADSGRVDGHGAARKVWEALDRKACPGHWMQVAYEAVVAALAAQGQGEPDPMDAIVQHCMVTEAVSPDSADPYGTISRIIDWHQANTAPPASPAGVPDELYRNACESVESWKARAIKAEETADRLMAALNDITGPTFMGEPVLPKPAAALDIKAMVDRFLGWRLPANFAPDCYIRFDPEPLKQWPGMWPVGTNLLDADQAEQMFRYVLAAPSQGEPS